MMNIDYFRRRCGHEIGGIWVPRVTAITDIVNKPALLRYYAQQESYEAAQVKLKNSANWGTLTHSAVEQILKGQEPKIDPKIAPSIEAFLEWKNQHQIKILDPGKDVERVVFDSENLYAGRMDALIEVDNELGVLDLKTGTGIWEEYYLQTAAYLNAYNRMVEEKERAEKRWILRVEQYQECVLCGAKLRKKSGKDVVKGGNSYCNHKFGEEFGIFEFKELPNFEHDIVAFLHAKNLWEWYNRESLNRINNYPKKFK